MEKTWGCSSFLAGFGVWFFVCLFVFWTINREYTLALLHKLSRTFTDCFVNFRLVIGKTRIGSLTLFPVNSFEHQSFSLLSYCQNLFQVLMKLDRNCLEKSWVIKTDQMCKMNIHVLLEQPPLSSQSRVPSADLLSLIQITASLPPIPLEQSLQGTLSSCKIIQQNSEKKPVSDPEQRHLQMKVNLERLQEPDSPLGHEAWMLYLLTLDIWKMSTCVCTSHQ